MPVVIELVGLPGSGKTTVLRELLGADPRVADKPVLRDAGYRLALAAGIGSALATLVRHRALRGRTRDHVVMMAYVQALPGVLSRPAFRDRIVVFDQGPIYFLARPALREERLAPWRARMLERWRSRLDLVAFLEAPDAVLRERIDTRSGSHRIKGSADEPAVRFLTEARGVYEDALGRLEAGAAGPALLRLDTSRVSVDETVARVLAAADARRSPQSSSTTPFAR